MKKKFLSILSLILALTMIFPMGISVSADDVPATGAPVIEPTAPTIYNGGSKNSVKLNFKAPGGAQNVQVIWSSFSPFVSVAEDGTVTARAVGEATVTATYTYTLGSGESAQNFNDSINTTVTVAEYKITAARNKDTKTNWIEGQTVKKDDIKIVADYSDGTKDQPCTDFTFEPAKISNDTKKIIVTVAGYSPKIEISINVAAYNPAENVKSISVDSPKSGLEYSVGDTLSAKDVLIKVVDNENNVSYIKLSEDGKTLTKNVTKSGDLFGKSLEHTFKKEEAGKELKVTIGYGGKTAELTAKVKEKATEPENVTYDYVVKVIAQPTKKEYKISDTALDLTGAEVSVYRYKYVNGTQVDTAIFASNSSGYNSNHYNSSFKDALTYEFNTVKFEKTGDNQSISKRFRFFEDDLKRLSDEIKVEFTGIKVKAAVEKLEYTRITDLVLDESKYPVGHKFTTLDIDYIRYKPKSYSGTEKLSPYQFKDYDNTFDLVVLDSRGREKSRNAFKIEESDVQTDSKGNRYVTVALLIDYNKEIETDVYIGESSKVQYIYDGDVITTYEDLEKAYRYTTEQDKSLEDFDLSKVKDSRSITLKLGEDQKSRIRTLDTLRHNVVIDLNGFSVTMDSDAVSIDRYDDYTLTVTNTSSSPAKFTYYDKNLTLTLEKGDYLVFKYDSETKKATVPGIYSVEVTCGANGTYSSTPKSDSKDVITTAHGAEIRFTFTPKAGYQIDAVVVGGKAVSEKDYTVSSSGIVTYTLKNITENTIVRATFKEQNPLANWNNPFTDVSERNSYYEAVAFVYQNELFKGTSTDKFSPNTSMTRAMFVTVLGRLAGANVSRYSGKSSFTDVDKDPKNSASNWYAPYVQWAVDNGIVEGYGDGKFGPNNKITHQQMYVIMYRYTAFIAKKNVTLPSSAYISAIDADDVADWALKETKFASENDYLVKTGSRIEPAAEATRAELATLLLSYCKNVLGWENGKK